MDYTRCQHVIQSTTTDSTHHSSDEEESVKVGVGLRFRFLVLPSSIDATASLSALLLEKLYDDAGGGGGDSDAL